MTKRPRQRVVPGLHADESLVRACLQQLIEGHAVPAQEAAAAQAAFERLYPRMAPGEVLVRHAWCACGHEHMVYTATNEPSTECHWVFCRCPGFRLRSPQPPTEEEKLVLARESELARQAYQRSKKP